MDGTNGIFIEYSHLPCTLASSEVSGASSASWCYLMTTNAARAPAAAAGSNADEGDDFEPDSGLDFIFTLFFFTLKVYSFEMYHIDIP